jgi:uncharacterized protein YprB with RNaseH-like and TPR domain
VSSLAERLRGVVRTVQSGVASAPPAVAGPLVPPAGRIGNDAADVLDGEWREASGRRFLVVDRKYGPGYRHGRVALADCLPPETGVWPRLELLQSGANVLGSAAATDRSAPHEKLLFLDLETTGLAGGAGTYAFLVGCGWFDGATFRLRQFFLADFGAERALLESVADLAAGCAGVVTYNGKTFDLPVIETRFVLQRMRTPFADLAHVDMLHPARRLWREEDAECRLMNLERTLCGHDREGDVPGFEIPSRYFQYVRSGDARPLEAVLEHNRLDIISLAMVTARASQLLADGPSAAATPREALGIGRLYERAGMTAEALESFSRAADIGSAAATQTPDTIRGAARPHPVRAEALRAYAMLCRRLRRYSEAAVAWRGLLDCDGCLPALAREANEALAVHHEHRARDLQAARMFAMRSLPLQATPGRREAVQYRLARIERKMSSLFPLTS